MKDSDDDEVNDSIVDLVAQLIKDQKAIKATLGRVQRQLREEGYGEEDEDDGD